MLNYVQSHYVELSVIVVQALVLVRAVVQLTPSKEDDKVVDKILGYVKQGIDLIKPWTIKKP